MMKKLASIAVLVGLAGFFFWKSQKPAEIKFFGKIGSSLSKDLASLIVPKSVADDAPTAIGTLRNNIFLLIGYPSTEVYTELNPNGGGPQDGLIGMMESVFTGIASIANANGIAACEDVPATGSYTGSITILETAVDATLTFETPTKTVPTGWTNAGETYAKRAKVVAGTITVAVEFGCDRKAAWAAMQLPGDQEDLTGEVRALDIYFDLESEDAKKFEMGMKLFDDDNECGSSNNCETWLFKATTGADNLFSLWQTSIAWRGTKFQGERIILNGNSSTKSMSSYYTFESDFGTTLASVSGSDQGVLGTPDFDFSSSTTADLNKQGCIDYDDPTATLSATTVCNGYSLTAASSNAISSDGNFSYNGVKLAFDDIDTF